eukprot:6175295-Pleurochrysis_carterae.AAC.7
MPQATVLVLLAWVRSARPWGHRIESSGGRGGGGERLVTPPFSHVMRGKTLLVARLSVDA